MKDMKRVRIYFKKIVYRELIRIIKDDIGKEKWDCNVSRRNWGIAFDDEEEEELIDIDILTGMIIIDAAKNGNFDEFDYEDKKEIVQLIMDKFKNLMHKTFHEICVNYMDIDIRGDIYEFMRTKAAMMKMSYSHHSIDDMRYELIRDTEMRFKRDLMMDCQRSEMESLEGYIEDVAFSLFPTRRKAA